MRYAETLPRGLSIGRLPSDAAGYVPYAEAGLQCLELSFTYDYCMNQIDFPANAEAIGRDIRSAGLQPWSFHLPFSGRLEIAGSDAELHAVTLYTYRTLIRAAAQAGCQVIVLHPSSEPIAEEKRPGYLSRARETIVSLQAECARNGLRLAVENLPRTCLCRTSDEMIALLAGTGAGVVFDTNHALTEDNVDFLKALTAAGLQIHTLHLSDYFPDADGVLDERHVFPGDGINRWQALFAVLEQHGYSGPMLYETLSLRSGFRSVPATLEQLADNMRRLASGEIQ